MYNVPKFEHRLDKFESGVYTPSATELTYETLLKKARQQLERGEIGYPGCFVHALPRP